MNTSPTAWPPRAGAALAGPGGGLAPPPAARTAAQPAAPWPACGSSAVGRAPPAFVYAGAVHALGWSTSGGARPSAGARARVRTCRQAARLRAGCCQPPRRRASGAASILARPGAAGRCRQCRLRSPRPRRARRAPSQS